MAGGKTIALTTWTFAGKGLLFYMLSRFVIAFLPRNKYFISWLQSPFSVILEPKKIKSVSASTFPLLFAMKWWDQMSWSQFCFFFFNAEFQASSISVEIEIQAQSHYQTSKNQNEAPSLNPQMYNNLYLGFPSIGIYVRK